MKSIIDINSSNHTKYEECKIASSGYYASINIDDGEAHREFENHE